MFKKLLTTTLVLAVLIAAGSAFAGDMDWKFYGKLHSSINMLSNGENSQLGLTSNTSRFGFKGSSAMNADYDLIWQFESVLNIAQNSGTSLGTRNTFVGIANEKLGRIQMGIHDSPFKTLGRKATFFQDEIGDFRQMTFGTDSRYDDLLMWISPDWTGFSMFLAYQFDQNSGKLNPYVGTDATFDAETKFSGMASYAKDEFMLGAAMEMWSKGYAATEPGTGGTTLYGDNPMAMRFVGKYMGDQFGVTGLFQTIKAQYSDLDKAFVDMKAQTLGFEAMFKANEQWNIKGAYYMADPDTDADNDDYGLLAFGVERVFTKNVMWYAQFATLSYGDAADNWELGGPSNGFGSSVAGFENADGTFSNPTGFSIGTAVTW